MSLTGLGEVAELANTVVNKIWPDKSEQEKAELVAAVQLVNGQLDINKAEATNPNVFVSGWRPFIGWVCGIACAWNWIGISVVSTALTIWGRPIVLKTADVSEMMPVLLGLLGLGALRTYERVKDVHRS
jgi:hypothetical protein